MKQYFTFVNSINCTFPVNIEKEKDLSREKPLNIGEQQIEETVVRVSREGNWIMKLREQRSIDYYLPSIEFPAFSASEVLLRSIPARMQLLFEEVMQKNRSYARDTIDVLDGRDSMRGMAFYQMGMSKTNDYRTGSHYVGAQQPSQPKAELNWAFTPFEILTSRDQMNSLKG